jgi:hypothetical protein
MSVSAPTMGTCGKCGAAMDASRAVYDKTGTLLCPACSATSQIAEGDARAVSSTVGSAVGVVVGGIFSITCFNPFLLVSSITIVSAVGWLLMVARNPSHRARMGGKFVPCLVAVIFGLLCALIPNVVAVLGLLGLALGR